MLIKHYESQVVVFGNFCISVDFKKPSSPILTPQDLLKYIDDPKYCHEDIESSSALKHGVSVLHSVTVV